MQTPWSNGQVEGQVHRLKLIKRQMYGRASFDLLGLRVRNTLNLTTATIPRKLTQPSPNVPMNPNHNAKIRAPIVCSNLRICCERDS